MQALLVRYENYPLALRLLALSIAATMFNGLYCLVYRYATGNPATLWEAFSWGAINLAPWIAAIEIGRHMEHVGKILLILIAAGIVSLILGAAAHAEMPNSFEIVRRIPGMAFALLALGAINLTRHYRALQEQNSVKETLPSSCDWVRAAGNYVELHTADRKPRLIRASLQEFAERQHPPLVRIHRSYAVAPGSIARIERGHVRLECGLRLPIGDRYRDQLAS